MSMRRAAAAPPPAPVRDGRVDDDRPRTGQIAAAGGSFVAGDPLRAIAALSVFAFHAAAFALAPTGRLQDAAPGTTGYRAGYGEVPGALLSGAGYGLMVFFVLSGYLISGPFVRAYVEGAPGPRLGAYLRNRALRILPALWAVVAALLVLTGDHGASADHIVRVLTLTEDWSVSRLASVIGPAWTLNVEARFYLAIPAVALVLALGSRVLRRPWGARERRAFVVALALAAAAVSIAATSHRPALRTLTLAAQLYAFMPGVVLAAVEPVLARACVNVARCGRWRRSPSGPPRSPSCSSRRWSRRCFAPCPSTGA